jgi:hypothetical protein
MRIVYIAHPISGDVKGNLEKIRLILRYINLNMPDVVPFAPYWIDCHALDDTVPAERERGIKNDHEFLTRGFIDEMWLYGDRISNGMSHEIALAEKQGIPVFSMTNGTDLLLHHRKALKTYEKNTGRNNERNPRNN